jgi:adhesin transport system outer membrane protein
MKQVRSPYLFFVAAIFLVVGPGITLAQTLQEAVQTTIETNPDIRAAAFNRLARDEQVRQARAGYFPQLEVSGGLGTDEVNEPFNDTLSPQEMRISLRQNLFAGLATMNETERQRARVKSEAYVIRATTENSALKTTKAYLDVLRYQALMDLAKENLLVHQQIGDQIKLRSQSGVGRRSDMDQVNSRVRLAQANVVVAEQNLTDARTNYEAVVGTMPEQLTRPEMPEDLLPASLDEAMKTALASHPTLQSARADLNARKAQDAVARSPFMPSLDLEVDQVWEDEYNYSYAKREDLRALVRLRYNLFNGWKDQARKAETVHLIREARQIRNHTHRQVQESIRLSWMAYQSASRRLPYLDQRVQFATATAKSYHQQWNIGKRTLLDVLDAEAERIDARIQYIDTDYNRLHDGYRVLNGMGRLVKALQLQLPVEAQVDAPPTLEDNEDDTSSGS